MFGLVSNPTWHDDFYRSQLQTAIKRSLRDNRYPELLISGCADYALLAYALRAVDSLNARNTVRIKVIDICPTPLLTCGWYAKQCDADVTLEEVNIREAPEKMNGQFDVIVADAFLTRFSRADSEKVVATWTRLLRPGGTVITTVRLHPLDAPYIRGIEDEVSDFVTRARRRAARWLWCLDARLDGLTSSARRYALRIQSHNVGDLDEVQQLFTANGFRVEFSDLQPVPGELRPTKYAQITAIKRKWA
jgi:SAM-dependent methyltransferase